MSITEALRVAGHLQPPEQELVQQAYECAARAHAGQERRSGEPYVEHPLEVANILSGLKLDAPTVIAALLHDTVEDTDLTLADIRKRFGSEVAKLVEGVTKLSRISFRTDQELHAENIRKMLLAMAEDIRVVLIKLADRLHNMRTLEPLPPVKRERIARETMEIYAPLAHRLGIWQIKWELEDLAFRILQPDAYQDVVRRMNRKRQDRESLVSDLSEILDRELKAIGIEGNISGRPKHVYSIWQKMVRDRKDFSQIYDLQALRVTVDTIKDCYGVLGVVHSIWKPLPGRFKDYIAMRKSNGYQSLHTTVISHTGEPIEVQIRTHEMHQVAEFGIAAHWLYKEGVTDSHIDRKLEWLRLLMEWQKEVSDAQSFVDAVKVDIFQDEVFVFSPKGDVFNLPHGSTPVDFAYRVHTEIGNRCIGAKVNGRMVPLDYELANGEIVEILASREPKGPSRDWLNFVQSASARDRIRKWFKSQRREENVAKGRDLLEKELGRMHRLTFSQLPDGKLEEIAHHYSYSGVEDLLAAIGYGDLSPHTVVMRLSLAPAEEDRDLKAIPLLPRSIPTPQVLVRGEKGILTRSASCCHPVPGDAITGFTTRGKGITVHQMDCVNALHPPDPERVLQVDWDMEAAELYPVVIKIEAWDRNGLLRDIAAVVAEQRVNLQAASAQVYDDKTSVISATVEVDSMAQLSRLMEKLEHIRDVHTVAREVG